jgi:hypothetical protein
MSGWFHSWFRERENLEAGGDEAEEDRAGHPGLVWPQEGQQAAVHHP